MLKFTKALLLLGLINVLLWTSNSVKANQVKTLVVSSDEWCPYVCYDDALPGFLVEVVKEIAEANQINVKFSLTPLARGLTLIQQGKVDILLALTSQHITDYQLQQSKFSFGGLYNDFYIKVGQQWYFKDMNHLKDYLTKGAILGTINGYKYGEEIDLLLKENQAHVFSASGNSPLIKQLEMLKMGRVDILLDSRFSVQYQLNKLQEKEIVYAGTQGNFTPLFLGYSSSLSQEIITVFDQGLITLRQSGKLARILEKYGVADWYQNTTSTKNYLNKTTKSIAEPSI
jgi:polar amino acid transport system substrate-binding protein